MANNEGRNRQGQFKKGSEAARRAGAKGASHQAKADKARGGEIGGSASRRS